MTQIVVLRLADPPAWMVTDAAGAMLGPVSSGPLEAAAPLAAERRLIVIVPGSSVTLARPELPVRSGSRVAQVVPYALEESLAGDVEQFHFATGATDPEGRTEVAAVRREDLRAWLDALAAAGLQPEAMVPDLLCLPDNPGKTVVLLDGGQLLVRAPAALPVLLDAEPLTEAFALAGLEGDDRHLHLYVSQQDWEHSRDMVEALREVTGTLDLQLLPDDALPLLAAGAAGGPALSLLQGEFARRTGWRAEWHRWRIAAALALALLTLHVGARVYDLVSLGAEESRLDAATEQAFRIALPDAERMVDPRAQISQRLAGSGASDPDGLLARLSAVGNAMGGAPGQKFLSLGWRAGTLDLRLTAPSTDTISQFAQGLAARGLNADVQSTTPRDGGVEAQLSISAGAGQ